MMRIARDRVSYAVGLGSSWPRYSGKDQISLGRIIASIFAIGGGIVHLVLAGPHFEEARWLGTAFLLDGVALCAVGLLLLGATKQSVRAAVLVAALTVAAYLVSRTIGLPGMEREEWDLLGLSTTIAEFTVIVLWPVLNRSRPDLQRGRGLIREESRAGNQRLN